MPYVFSDGDGIDQNNQVEIQKLWEPLLKQNCEMFFKDEVIMIDQFFFNFPISIEKEINFLCNSDGMHILKRIRYEAVNHHELTLARQFNDSIQIVTFYVLDFRKIVKGFCPDYIFSNDPQTKMDDEYPHLLFGGKMCEYLVNQAVLHQKDEDGKNAFK